MLDDLGLRAGINWLARTLREHGGLQTAVDWVAEDGERLDPELETLVFRIAQEGLNNVAKHSGQLQARLSAQRRAGSFEFEIADDGRGFDVDRVLGPADGATGLGLRGMRDRVELFGGRLAIESTPGQGSRLRVVIPLAEASP